MRNLRKLIGRWGVVGGLLLGGLWLAGCASAGGSNPKYAAATTSGGAEANPAPGSALAAAPTGSDVVDKIHAGDVLKISYQDLPITVPDAEVRVKTDGTITLLLNKTFMAAGKTRSELEQEIRSSYVPDYYRTMTVSVQKQRDTEFFFVLGEVRQPSREVYISQMTVLKAIASAGGFTDFAKKRGVELTRTDGRKFVINAVKAQKDPRLDLEVLPGDKVWVPRRNAFGF